MCGIVGYFGFRRADKVLISALKRLEYRGYDSWGIAVRTPQNEITVYKKVGAIGNVLEFKLCDGCMGIGHTRWATHGKPSDVNAHPHTDCEGKIAVVHNGIISNFQKIREKLKKEGHKFNSETDTEVIPHLIEKYCRSMNYESAVMNTIENLDGSYAFVSIKCDEDKMIACRYKSPLVLGIGDGEFFFASDATAVLEYTNRVIYLEDGDIVVISKDGYKVINNGAEVTRNIEVIPWDLHEAEKGGYEHFMLKEIHENPKVIEDTLIEYLNGDEIEIDFSFAVGISDIVFVACGTSYHASLVGKYVLESLVDIPVRVEYASEFNYHDIPLSRSLVIGITQSGETADTLEALRKAKRFGAKTLAITNVLGSTVTRIVDHVLYTRAGPEISVCATKTFIAQLIVLYALALKLSTISKSELREFLENLRNLPNKIRIILDKEIEIKDVAEKLANYENIMYIGRAIGYPVAMEGALKMKEISYIHAEGYPAGELKHGPFALLGKSMPVIACVIKDNTYDIMLSNVKEVKARESPVIAIADEKDIEIEKFVDRVIRVPTVNSILTPVTYSVALQLLAYYTARKRGCEIDKPRHLAKSVTVE